MILSIITVTYQNSVGLKKTYDSIASQTLLDGIEWIVVDGGSTDGSKDFLESNPLVKKWVSEPDKGIYDAQNKGIAMSSGDWLYFLNAGDTLYNKTVLGDLRFYLDQKVSILYAGICILSPNGEKTFSNYPDELSLRYWSRDSQYLCHQALLYRKELFVQFGVYDTNYRFAADFEQLMRFWNSKDVPRKKIRFYIANYSLDGTSANEKNRQRILNEYAKIIFQYFPFADYLIYQLFRLQNLRQFFDFVRKLRIRIKNFKIKNGKMRFIHFIQKIIFKKSVARIKFDTFIKDHPKTSPRILHLSYHDTKGGAARAATSIHLSLKNSGFESILVVESKNISDENTFVIPIHSKDYHKIQSIRAENLKKDEDGKVAKSTILFSDQFYSSFNIEYILLKYQPDIVHLHWIANDFLSIEDIGKIKLPVVWTLHDMWPFCAGSHIDLSKDYETGYSNIPTEDSVWQRKKNSWESLKLYPVGVSNWMSNEAKRSLLFKERKVTQIPNIVDISKFPIHTKDIARQILGLPLHKKIILFGSDYLDKNKNLSVIYNFQKSKNNEDFYFISFGDSRHEYKPNNLFTFDYISEEQTLGLLYSAADVFLVPSKIESFCFVAAEAIACGTPVVAFDTSGLKDIVIEGKTGYRAKCYNQEDFESLVLRVLNEGEKKFPGHELRNFIMENFSTDKISLSYTNLYQSILN